MFIQWLETLDRVEMLHHVPKKTQSPPLQHVINWFEKNSIAVGTI
jgi:hypothetical protein